MLNPAQIKNYFFNKIYLYDIIIIEYKHRNKYQKRS